MNYNYAVGIDVSKKCIDVAVFNKLEYSTWQKVNNKVSAIKKHIRFLIQNNIIILDETIFCLEHTGIYNNHVISVLLDLGANICVENASQIKLTLGIVRGKNDKIDSIRIAEYAMRFADKLKLYVPKRKVIGKLQTLSALRRRLSECKKMIKQPLKESKKFIDAVSYKLLEHSSKRMIKCLTGEIKYLENEIAKLIREDITLNHQISLICSVPGVGMVTATELVIVTNEFGDFSCAKKIACYAGIAPFGFSSGSSIKRKSRVSHKANKKLKTLIHLCAMAAIRSKGELQDYYHKKVAEGKNKMSVLNAIRNKIIHRVFAVVKNQVMYQKNYNLHLAKP